MALRESEESIIPVTHVPGNEGKQKGIGLSLPHLQEGIPAYSRGLSSIIGWMFF